MWPESVSERVSCRRLYTTTNRPTQENDPMGEGPVLQVHWLKWWMHRKYTEIKAEQQYDKIVVKK